MMTIDQVLHKLSQAKPDARVYLSPFRCVPTRVESWRGKYAEPAMGWTPSGYSAKDYPDLTTASTLIESLEEAISGRIFDGWKGGEYRFHRHQTLHVDNRGECTNTEIQRIEISDYEVVIYVAQEE